MVSWTPPALRLQQLQWRLSDGAAELPGWCEAWRAQPRFATYFLSRLTVQKQLRLLQMMREAALETNVWHFNCAIAGCEEAWQQALQLLRFMVQSQVRSDSTSLNSLSHALSAESTAWHLAVTAMVRARQQAAKVEVRCLTALAASLPNWPTALGLMCTAEEPADGIAWTAVVQGKDLPWSLALRLLCWMAQARLRADAVLHRACGDAVERRGAWPLALRVAAWRRGGALLNRVMAGMAKRGQWEAALHRGFCDGIKADAVPDEFTLSCLLDALQPMSLWSRAFLVARDAASRSLRTDLISHNSLLSCALSKWPWAVQQLQRQRPDPLSYGFAWQPKVAAAMAISCQKKDAETSVGSVGLRLATRRASGGSRMLGSSSQVPDFGRGWPHPELLEGHLPQRLAESFQRGLRFASESLNYGTSTNSFRFGHPEFLKGLAGFLSQHYGAPVEPSCLMTTGGASMGVDLAMRSFRGSGGVCVFEEPTYYLSFNMARDQGLECRSVPMYQDGMDLDRLEEMCMEGNVRMVYTIPVHHNPTGYTMGNAKRQRLIELARKYDFMVVADEAYQLLNFGSPDVRPLYFHDSADDPRVVSVGTFSKLIGPGVKVGWLQADARLLKRMATVGYVESGGNPVTFSSMALLHFMTSGQLDEHIAYVSGELSQRCQWLCRNLRELDLEVYEPRGLELKGRSAISTYKIRKAPRCQRHCGSPKMILHGCGCACLDGCAKGKQVEAIDPKGSMQVDYLMENLGPEASDSEESHPSAISPDWAFSDRKSYQALLKENQSERIVFLGSFEGLFQKGLPVVCSFPGAYGSAWNFLTTQSKDAESKLRTSCIFLPDKDAPGFGEHILTGDNGSACHCMHLYGQPQDFGCAWYKLWMRKTLQAVEKDCDLIVVTKADGSLGTSQHAEARFLEQGGHVYCRMNISEFVLFHADDAPESDKTRIARDLQERMEKCKRAKDINREKVKEIRAPFQPSYSSLHALWHHVVPKRISMKVAWWGKSSPNQTGVLEEPSHSQRPKDLSIFSRMMSNDTRP
eukprot:s2639_g7.t2